MVAVLDACLLGALSPLLPEFERRLGLSSDLSGLLVGSYSIGLLVGSVPAGLLTSRIGPKATALAGLALLSASSIAFALAETYWLLVAARALEGVGSALAWTAVPSWLVAVFAPERRGRVFGFVFGASFVGLTVGPGLGSIASVVGIDAVFFGIAAVVATTGLAAWKIPGPAPLGVRPLVAYLELAGKQGLPYTLWLLSLPGVLSGLLTVSGPLQLGDRDLHATEIGAVFVVAALVQGVLSPIIGRWCERVRVEVPLALALSTAGVGAIALAYVADTTAFAAAIVVTSAAYGVVLVPATMMLAAAVDRAREDQPLGFALMNLVFAPANIVGALLAGSLRGVAGDAAVFWVFAVICLGTFVFGLLRRRC